MRLSAGEEEQSYDFSFFSVVIGLTDAGCGLFARDSNIYNAYCICLYFLNLFEKFSADHVEDIVGLLFKYLSLLQSSGVKESMFNEVC